MNPAKGRPLLPHPKRAEEEAAMSHPGGTGADRAGGEAVPSGDSPKPHGDKIAGTDRPAAEGARGPGEAVPSGDSPKPHGDKLAGCGDPPGRRGA